MLLPGGVILVIYEIGSMAPRAMMMFLILTLSPARFPSAQTDCSTTSRL